MHGKFVVYPSHEINFSVIDFTGSDVARGMLIFARGRPLGKDGLDWLKIHLINLHGSLKKATLKERIDFADGKMDEILDSADNPLTVSGKLYPLAFCCLKLGCFEIQLNYSLGDV